jgi:hypothetical protein
MDATIIRLRQIRAANLPAPITAVGPDMFHGLCFPDARHYKRMAAEALASLRQTRLYLQGQGRNHRRGVAVNMERVNGLLRAARADIAGEA